jgi:UDP-glucose 4-epimerase
MERRKTPCRLSPRIAAERRDRLNVFGGDCDSSDRTGMRDYVHVVDLAQGMLPRSSWPLERVWLLQLVP